MDDVMRDIGDGVIGITDDLVFGKDVESHDAAMHKLMEVSERHGVVYRRDKCHVSCPPVKLYGMVWSKDGMQPDGVMCDDIREKSPPGNKQELHSFLGLVRYLGTFVPHLSDKTDLVRSLLKSNVEWCWEAEHQWAFEDLNLAVHEDMSLRYFDPSKPVEIECDASMVGLGACLLQEGKPIAFASKALTPTESRYANIEREMLAVVFSLKKFHTYIFGRPVVVYSDLEPLSKIQLKNLSDAPPRLQGMLLAIQPYDAEVRYRPSKQMTNADYLSRVGPRAGDQIEVEKAVYMMQISSGQLDKVRSASAEDPMLCTLWEQVIYGWPAEPKLVPKVIRSFWSMSDYVSVEDGVLYFGSRMIVPESMRGEYLERIHASHQGVTKSQLRAKECLYWPNMAAEIESMVNDCKLCLENAKSKQKEPMLSHEVPSQAWKVLHSDFFTIAGHKYVVVGDQYSKMPFARALKNETASEVVKFCKDLFSVHGLPKTMYTDNGPQYDSQELRDLLNSGNLTMLLAVRGIHRAMALQRKWLMLSRTY